MSEIDKDFLKEVFKETNSHIRATDRKSLAVSGAYIGLFSVYLSSVAIGRWSEPALSAVVHVAVQAFFLLVGICIYIMQQWYRAWKEHYIEVCVNIRKQFMPDADYPGLLPYWLRHESPESRMSTDNLLKTLTATINFVLVFMMSYNLLELLSDRHLAILIVGMLILLYIAVVFMADRNIQNAGSIAPRPRTGSRAPVSPCRLG